MFKKYKRPEQLQNNIFAVKSMILSSMCFRNLKVHYELSIKLLRFIIDNTLKEGMHYLRSPSDHFYFLCSLLDIKNFIGNLNKEIPPYLNQVIDEMGSILYFFKIGDGNLAIFNKYEFISKNKINNVLKKIDISTDCLRFMNVMALRVSKNKLTFIMDCGKPTKEQTQAGTLSFEFSHSTEKIVVNCGSPFINNKDWNDAMRSTAAHSTLNINEINSLRYIFQ